MSSTPAPYKPPTAEEMDGISRPPPETTQQMHDDVAAHSKVHNHKGHGLIGKIEDMLEGNPDPDAYKSTEYQGESPADIANKAQSMAARGYTQAGVTAFNAADPKGTVHPMPEG